MDGIEFKIAKLELGPRDVLVVKVNERISTDICDRIVRYIEARADIGNRILVIDAALDLAVLTRAEIDARSVAPSDAENAA